MDAQLWEEQFPAMMQNVINACQKHGCKLVFFDNTYMYPKTGEPQTEESPFAPVGKKSVVRAKMATLLLQAMNDKSLEAVICRAPEFYGPSKTQSLTNALIFDNIRQGKKPKVPLKDDTRRTLIWTPDASRAMALIGNTPDAYNQTWHLPCDEARLTYKELISLAAKIYQKELDYTVLKMWVFRLGGLFNKGLKEVQELLPRYACDNIFVSDKFKNRFPGFRISTYEEDIGFIMSEQKEKSNQA